MRYDNTASDPHVLFVDEAGCVEWCGLIADDLDALRHEIAADGAGAIGTDAMDTIRDFIETATEEGYTIAEAFALLGRVLAGEVTLSVTDYGRAVIPPRAS